MGQVYSPYELAIELGFSVAEAERYQKLGVTAINLRHIAKAKGMPSTKPTIPPPDKGEGKPHKHSYRKDGTCACGVVRKAKKAKGSAK